MSLTIRILGLDPGLAQMGWGVIDVSGSRLAHVAHYDGLWPVVHIHDSLDESISIYERRP